MSDCAQCEGTGKWCGYHGAGECSCPGTDCGDCTHGNTPLSSQQADRLRRVVRRDDSMTTITRAVLGGKFEEQGLVRVVRHRDSTRSWALTRAGRAALAKADR